MTDIFAYFAASSRHDDGSELTARLTVPIASPIARLARYVTASPRRVAAAADHLRTSITSRPCAPAISCPALDGVKLVEALEHATR